MPEVSKKYRKKLDEVKLLLEAINFDNRQNTDLTCWSILALQDHKPQQTKAGFDSLAEGASIRDILDFCRAGGTNYAENTRESLRKLSRCRYSHQKSRRSGKTNKFSKNKLHPKSGVFENLSDKG
ncbi:hypothetical protein HZC20_01855 [Candidatus Peregrinibacteria bacterium]|nr:hypothetical protein [Candidatus Peregrinibacteria bacterium]